MTKIYVPSPTIEKFLASTKRVQLLLGPIGAGKTTGVLMKLLLLAHQQAPDQNGLRRTRWACVRNTRPQLKDSVLKSVFAWLPPDGDRVIWKEAETTMLLRLKQPDGTKVMCEIMFRALDDERDAQRLLSVEFTGVWFSEFREIPYALLTDALSRTGRYPEAAAGGPTWRGLLGETNMPTSGSDWHRYIEVDKPDNMDAFIQPSALSADAENIEHLEPDYYTDLMSTATENWIKAHVTSEYPDAVDGKAVFAQSFNRTRHVSATKLRPIRDGGPVVVGIDQGRNPAAVFGQMEPHGRIVILHTVSGQNMGMERFVVEHLLPAINANFAGMPILGVIDPAGVAKSQVNELSPLEVLKANGIRTIPAPTNALSSRLESVERALLRNNGMIFDPSTLQLIAAMNSEYKFRTRKSGETDDIPDKRHPWSDLADALQYLCLTIGGAHYGRIVSRLKDPPKPVRPPSNRAWA